MSINIIIGLVVTITAIASYINYRFLRLPQPIGVTLLTILLAICLMTFGYFGLGVGSWARSVLEQVNLSETLLNGLLSFLLFAGALHINVIELAKFRWVVGALATISVVISTMVVGFLTFYVARWLNIDLPLINALLFGAIISPTDPIAVLAILKNIRAPKNIEMKIAGESLFNDGIAIVLFVMLLKIATGQKAEMMVSDIIIDFMWQAVGGILLGAALGWVVAKLMRNVAKFEVACLLTLALVTGGFAFADDFVDVSGPITIVVAGLIIGNMMRAGDMSESNMYRLDTFWELLDEILNTVLFVLIGLEVIHLVFAIDNFELALLAVPIALLSRYISIAVPVAFIERLHSFDSKAIAIMTWGGLRGGVSIALALQVPESEFRETIIWLTYAVVIFSIVVQGLTIKPMMVKWIKD